MFTSLQISPSKKFPIVNGSLTNAVLALEGKIILGLHLRGIWIQLGKDSIPINYSTSSFNQVTEMDKPLRPTPPVCWQFFQKRSKEELWH